MSLAAAPSLTGVGVDLPAVPLNDLRRQTKLMKAEIDHAIAETIDGGWYILGPNVSNFEREFAQYCGARHCLTVANGTDALELALRSLDVRPGREVVTVANAGMYAATAIAAVGGTPVFADIDSASMTLAPAALAQCIGPKTAAVVVTHLYGALANMPALLDVARDREVPIIEDCAQAHGAEQGGRKAGTFGVVGCYSFFPTKNLGALGDGGALVTSADDIAVKLRALRQYGWMRKYEAMHPGGRNSRLDEIQAAVLRVKLPYLDGWNARRREIIDRYRRAAVATIAVASAGGKHHAAHLCVVRSPRRAALRRFLAERKIASEIHYPIPDHRQEAMRRFVVEGFVLKETEAAAKEVLTIPCFPEMTEEEIARVCEALAEFDSDEGH